ncbi:MAG: glycosyltransferase family 2 protein [Ruminococcus sp.]|nr:glycosyltransferase family 2 protein [Ruminococcus sp.]MDE7097881.1 glycosyltransferase family 2 protein [Ruminococcus sp.]
MGDKITIIIPCYNEQETIPIFVEEMDKVYAEMRKKYDIRMEYLFVDDGSKDKTLKVLKEYSEKYPHISYITFSRNFGKEAGMFAGLENADGDYVVIIDADLQDPPELIEEMYSTIKNSDYDCVASRRVDRKGESKIRSFFAKSFYKIMSKISKTNIVDGARDFRMMSRPMVDAIVSLREYNRFSKGIFQWVGFNTKWLEFENRNRVAGTTKWSFFGLLLYAIDGIIAFSTVPLAFSSIIGIIFCCISFIMLLIFFIRALIWGDPVSGWPSLVCIICFTSGFILLCNGITGLYVSKIYSEVKNRPQYVIREYKKCKDDSENTESN